MFFVFSPSQGLSSLIFSNYDVLVREKETAFPKASRTRHLGDVRTLAHTLRAPGATVRSPGQVPGEAQEALPALAARAKQGLFWAAVWCDRHPCLMPRAPAGYQLTQFAVKLPVPAEKAVKKIRVLSFEDS